MDPERRSPTDEPPVGMDGRQQRLDLHVLTGEYRPPAAHLYAFQNDQTPIVVDHIAFAWKRLPGIG